MIVTINISTMDDITNRLNNVHINDCTNEDLDLIKGFVKLNIQNDSHQTDDQTNLSVDCLINDMEKINITDKNILIQSASTGKILTIPLKCGLYPHETDCLNKPLPWIEAF